MKACRGARSGNGWNPTLLSRRVLSVGRIAQVHPLEEAFVRGGEKSVFAFGGSAIAVLGEPGRWRPADDILRNASQSVETLIRLGEPVAAPL